MRRVSVATAAFAPGIREAGEPAAVPRAGSDRVLRHARTVASAVSRGARSVPTTRGVPERASGVLGGRPARLGPAWPRSSSSRGSSRVAREEWNALVGDDSPFLEWDWLASLEQAGHAGRRHGLAAAAAGRARGRPPGRRLSALREAAQRGRVRLRHGVGRRRRARRHRLLPEAAGGRALHARHGRALPRRRAAATGRTGCALLAGALRELCRENGFSGVHVNFCRDDEIAPLAESGYLLRLGLQYHWRNAGYRASRTTSARSAASGATRSAASGARSPSRASRSRCSSGDEIGDELFEPMYRFYRSTVEQHVWGRQYLNRAFFELLGRALPPPAVLRGGAPSRRADRGHRPTS